MQTHNNDTNTLEAKVFTQGTIKLPVYLRNELNIHDGDRVLFIKKGTEWVVTTHLNNIRSTQAFFSALRKDNDSVVDELIADRRKEAKLEFSK